MKTKLVLTRMLQNAKSKACAMWQLVIVCASMLGGVTPIAANAVLIQYDLVPLGGSDYRYVYSVVNDGSLGAGVVVSLFDVMFDPDIYDESTLAISTPTPPGADWDEIFLASAPGLPAVYDALALEGGIVPGATVSGFSVDFTWLGFDVPGSQPFAIYDPVSFALLEEGLTTANAIPLPAALWLLGSGIVTLLGAGCVRVRLTDTACLPH